MRLRVQHLVETLFSVRRDGKPPPRLEWLERRIELWRRFCLPSMAAQTAEGFAWLLFCDEATDPETLEQLRSWQREVPALEIAMTSADRGHQEIVRARVCADADVLITTWLDSDDALADRFLETVQAYAEPFAGSAHESLAVNFARGYRLDVATGKLYEDRMANSSFPSLLERPRRNAVQTVGSRGHAMLPHFHMTHQDESMHAWLISVHGGNVRNRIGSRAPARDVPPGGPHGFPASVMGGV